MAVLAMRQACEMVACDIFNVNYYFSTVRTGCGKIRTCELEFTGRALTTKTLWREAEAECWRKSKANPEWARSILCSGGQNDAKTSDLGGSGSEAG